MPQTTVLTLPLWGRWPSEARSDEVAVQNFVYSGTSTKMNIINLIRQPFGLTPSPKGKGIAEALRDLHCAENLVL